MRRAPLLLLLLLVVPACAQDTEEFPIEGAWNVGYHFFSIDPCPGFDRPLASELDVVRVQDSTVVRIDHHEAIADVRYLSEGDAIVRFTLDGTWSFADVSDPALIEYELTVAKDGSISGTAVGSTSNRISCTSRFTVQGHASFHQAP